MPAKDYSNNILIDGEENSSQHNINFTNRSEIVIGNIEDMNMNMNDVNKHMIDIDFDLINESERFVSNVMMQYEQQNCSLLLLYDNDGTQANTPDNKSTQTC